MVHLVKHSIIQMTDLILQSSFIYGTKLFQQNHRIFFNPIELTASISICVGSFALFILDVMAAQITVGLCLFPTLFWMISNRPNPALFTPHYRPQIRIIDIPSFNYHTIHTPILFGIFTLQYFHKKKPCHQL